MSTDSSPKFEGMSPEDAKVCRALYNYNEEAKSASLERSMLNQANQDTYLLKQDWSHKIKGQSKEFLAKQSIAVEQIVSFVQQGLIDLGDWFSVDEMPGVEKPKITAADIEKMLNWQLGKAKFFTAVGDGLKNGLLTSLMIAKVHGQWVSKPRYSTKESIVVKDDQAKVMQRLMRHDRQVWQLSVDMIPFRNYRIDPSGRNLYEMHEMELDLFDVKKQVKSAKNPGGIYDKEIVDQLVGDMASAEEAAQRARANGQNIPMSGWRKKVKILECWGTILDENGDILHENVVCAVANDRFLIRKPQENPFWHGSSPFVVAPIVRVPDSVLHKALMDAPTAYNKALNELFNLNLDCAMMAAHGIKQVRVDWLEDQSQIAGGIAPGTTLEANSQCPPGQHVLERVDTSSMSQESLAMLNITDKEFQVSALTNDLRMGVLPGRQVKATEVVESSQSITGMLNGIAKNIESDFIERVLERGWMVICQNFDDFADPEIKALLGEDRVNQIRSMSREERFAATVGQHTFKVFGITSTLNKMKDFRRITAFLQTISASEVLVEEFAKKYSFAKLLTEIMKALDIETDKLEADPGEHLMSGAPQGAPQMPGAPGMPGGAGPMPTPGAGPKAQSQIPQVASAASGPVPGTTFPGSRATSLVNGKQ